MISEHFATIADALSPRYRLERLLQSGIAAYVFLAEDRTSGRRVAVKVLRDEMTATVNAARFMAEIRVAGQLRHPNIVPVYESGDIAGLPYFVMPFIDGETLRGRLARLGRLSLADTLRITEDVARALDYAHRHHVVHRDIKPENVMIDRGRAVVLDFGIALALDALEVPRHTLPGLTLGTLHYMSPEQLDGEPEIDGRADVYSLACVVYEMLCGRPPFTGKPNTVIRRHLGELPRPLGATCPATPPKIGPALARALEKSPDARYPTAGAFVSALLGGMPRVRVTGQRVAVIPFANATGEPTVDTFSDGVSEEIAAALREYDGIVVACAAPVDSNRLDQHVSHVSRSVGADAVLFGDVRRPPDGASLVISGSLFDARSGRRIWSGASTTPHRSEPGELSSPARSVAGAVAGALGVARPARRAHRSGDDVTRTTLQPGARMESNGRSAAR
jgi:serine/threonine protein kinase